LPSGKLIDASAGHGTLGGGDKSRGQLAHLFVPELRRTTLLLWLIWAINAFCYYGMPPFMPIACNQPSFPPRCCPSDHSAIPIG
jgi:hypothetical protein